MHVRSTALVSTGCCRGRWRRQLVERILLTPVEAARALGIGRSKLYELLRNGVVPSVRIGSCRRIAVEDLAVAVDRLRREAGTDYERQAGRGRRGTRGSS